MDELDKKMISDLISKYGIEKVEWLIKVNEQLLNYMGDSNRNIKSKLCCETLNSQIFTNGLTSIFYLNKKQLDFNLLKQLTNPPIFVEKNELDKYFVKSNDLFGDAKLSISITAEKSLIYFKKLKEDMETISVNEYKLLRLLLKNPEIYASLKNTIIYAESEQGYAYILTKKNREQLIF